MNPYNQYYCSSCYNVWDQNQYIPKLLNCGHTFCLKCLQRLFKNNQITCPDDQISIKINSLNQLTTNQELLHPPIQRIQQYSLQNISSDQTKTHVNNNFPQNSYKEYSSQTREQLQQCHQQLQQSHQQYESNQQIKFNEVYKFITQQKQNLIEQIQLNFSNCQIQLQNLESQLLNDLNVVALQLEQKIKQMYSIVDNTEIQSIKQRIEQLLLLSNENLNKNMDLINSLTKQTNFLINKLTKQTSIEIKDIITKEMQIKFDFTIYDYLSQFCTIKKQNKNQLLLNEDSHSNQSQTQQSPKHKGFHNSNQKTFQFCKNSNHLQSLPFYRQNHRELTFGLGQTQMTRSYDSRSLSFSKLYQATGINRIKDYLYKGWSIQKLDLTNQNLNDSDIQDLINMIQESSSYIEILKLSKNRITDNGFNYLINLLLKRNDIHTLNLSNNDCTEKSINLMEGKIQQLFGKTIYLSNCKLNNLNQLKQKQIIFQNRGVILFL